MNDSEAILAHSAEKTRIKVMQIVAGIALGDKSGGAERAAVRIAEGIASDYLESAVFVMWHFDSPQQDEWLARLQKRGVRVYGLIRQDGVLFGRMLRALRSLIRAAQDFHPEIITTHSERSDVLALLTGLLVGYPLKLTRYQQTDEQWQKNHLIGRLLTELVFPWAFAAEVPLSMAVREKLEARPLARLLSKSTEIIYNGIPQILFEPRSNGESSQASETGGQIVSVGRLDRQKGYDVLLEAYALLDPTTTPDLAIVGIGPLESELRSAIETLGLTERVHLLGGRPNAFDLIGQARLFVSSSRWEGFPTVILEAMAQSVPVVATDASGSRELVRSGETGYLAAPNNPQSLARALAEALSDSEEAKRRARQANEEARAFTTERAVEAFRKLYTRLARA